MHLVTVNTPALTLARPDSLEALVLACCRRLLRKPPARLGPYLARQCRPPRPGVLRIPLVNLKCLAEGSLHPLNCVVRVRVLLAHLAVRVGAAETTVDRLVAVHEEKRPREKRVELEHREVHATHLDQTDTDEACNESLEFGIWVNDQLVVDAGTASSRPSPERNEQRLPGGPSLSVSRLEIVVNPTRW